MHLKLSPSYSDMIVLPILKPLWATEGDVEMWLTCAARKEAYTSVLHWEMRKTNVPRLKLISNTSLRFLWPFSPCVFWLSDPNTYVGACIPLGIYVVEDLACIQEFQLNIKATNGGKCLLIVNEKLFKVSLWNYRVHKYFPLSSGLHLRVLIEVR